MKRSMGLIAALVLVGSFFFVHPASASDMQQAATSDSLDSNYCADHGGTDITDSGKLVLGDSTSRAVICWIPASGKVPLRPANTAVATFPQPNTGIPLTEMTATFQLPSGTVSLANGQQFTTSCIANLSYNQIGNLPASTHGTSAFDCVGYNNGTKSLGCSVQWSGPTNVTGNVNPGGQAVAAFTCIIVKLETIQFISNYTYTDAIYQDLDYSIQNMNSSIKATN
jgi:hypothetical protein